MGLFDSDWQRLHKEISRQYELTAIRKLEEGVSPEGADVFGIMPEIVRKHLSTLNDVEVEAFVTNEYK